MAGAHPDFEGKPLPRDVVLGAFVLSPLGPDCADEDFAAVTGSAARLAGLFHSDWPQGLTFEGNRADLIWHMREFDFCRSFAWVVRSRGGVYLGCAYVYPALGERGRGSVYVWLRQEEGPQRTEDLRRLFTAWLEGLGLEAARYPVRVA